MPELPEKRLKRHYFSKYAQNPTSGTTALLRRYPLNRWEATVRWADSGERAIEIGAGGGEVLRAIRSSYK